MNEVRCDCSTVYFNRHAHNIHTHAYTHTDAHSNLHLHSHHTLSDSCPKVRVCTGPLWLPSMEHDGNWSMRHKMIGERGAGAASRGVRLARDRCLKVGERGVHTCPPEPRHLPHRLPQITMSPWQQSAPTASHGTPPQLIQPPQGSLPPSCPCPPTSTRSSLQRGVARTATLGSRRLSCPTQPSSPRHPCLRSVCRWRRLSQCLVRAASAPLCLNAQLRLRTHSQAHARTSAHTYTHPPPANCAGTRFFPGLLSNNRRRVLDDAALGWRTAGLQQMSPFERHTFQVSRVLPVRRGFCPGPQTQGGGQRMSFSRHLPPIPLPLFTLRWPGVMSS